MMARNSEQAFGGWESGEKTCCPGRASNHKHQAHVLFITSSLFIFDQSPAVVSESAKHLR